MMVLTGKLSLSRINLNTEEIKKLDAFEQKKTSKSWKPILEKIKLQTVSSVDNVLLEKLLISIKRHDFSSGKIIPLIPAEINNPSNVNDRTQPFRKLYYQLVVLWYFIKIIDTNSKWANKLDELIKYYNIPLIRLGFPEDWKSDPFWN